MPVDLPAEREDSRMDRARISRIADQWMIPTSKTAYMAGLRPPLRSTDACSAVLPDHADAITAESIGSSSQFAQPLA
jgi:hypothetical protein